MNDYSSTLNPFALLYGMGAFYMIFVSAIALIMSISLWKIFSKAGKPGWAAIVPIYNTVVLAEIVGKPWWFGLLVLIPYVGAIFVLISYYCLAAAFGKDKNFAIGIVLLPIVFLPILAFSKDLRYTLNSVSQPPTPSNGSVGGTY